MLWSSFCTHEDAGSRNLRMLESEVPGLGDHKEGSSNIGKKRHRKIIRLNRSQRQANLDLPREGKRSLSANKLNLAQYISGNFYTETSLDNTSFSTYHIYVYIYANIRTFIYIHTHNLVYIFFIFNHKTCCWFFVLQVGLQQAKLLLILSCIMFPLQGEKAWIPDNDFPTTGVLCMCGRNAIIWPYVAPTRAH